MKISLLVGTLFIISNQPMLMIGLLMLLVILYSLDIYFEFGSFWFGYILMLVILSGVLVVFTYVLSLVPNESFEFLSFVFLVLSFFYLFIMDFYYFMMLDLSFMSSLLWEGVIGILNIYLVLFLLSIMIMVVYVSSPQEGALRL